MSRLAQAGAPSDGWIRTKLGEILDDIQPGFASGKHSRTADGLPHLRPMNVSREGGIDRRDLRSIDPALADVPRRRLRRGDVLFNNTNSPELVGKTALFDDDDEPAFSNHMTRLRVQPDAADPAYIAKLLHGLWRSGEFQRIANNHVSQASIGRDVLSNLEISLPPLTDQRRIVARLDEIDQRRTAAATHLQNGRDTLQRFRGAVLAAACSGRLTADWRQAAGREQLPSAGQSSAAWRATDLGHLIDRIEAGKSVRSQGRPATADEWGVIKVSAMSWGAFRESENKAVLDPALINPAYEVRPGDLLFSRANTADLVGAVVLVGSVRPRLMLSDKSLRLIPGPNIDKAWLRYALSSPAAKAQLAARATGTSDSMRNLSQPKILATTLTVPPLDEQREIVRRVDALFTTTVRLTDQIDQAQRALGSTGKAALTKAFRGELA